MTDLHGNMAPERTAKDKRYGVSAEVPGSGPDRIAQFNSWDEEQFLLDRNALYGTVVRELCNAFQLLLKGVGI